MVAAGDTFFVFEFVSGVVPAWSTEIPVFWCLVSGGLTLVISGLGILWDQTTWTVSWPTGSRLQRLLEARLHSKFENNLVITRL